VETWWNDTGRKLLIRPPEFSGNSTNSHLIAKQEELEKEINLAYKIFILYLEWFFNMP
jgi:hypothetical protein